MQGVTEEAIITVRGKQRYVVLSVDQYNYLRECELEAALAETHQDVAAGRTVSESVEDHIQRITSA